MAIEEIVFLHFNDVYHISKRENIARFLTLLQTYRERHARSNPYTVFSGDIFSPSLEASILRGSHMLPLLKELKVDLGCYGNHDFDFGEHRLKELASQTDFPWLLSNAIRHSPNAERCTKFHSDGLLAGAIEHHTAVLQGFKVGFFGLAGTDWPSNCRELPDCTIASPVETARAGSRHLRVVENCDIVVGVTHMRLTEDIEVSEALKSGPWEEHVDLLLGGHDHELLRRFAGETERDPSIVDCSVLGSLDILSEARGYVRIVKSGTDWDSLSCVRMQIDRAADGQAVLRRVLVEQISDITKISLEPAMVQYWRNQLAESLRGVDSRIETLGADPLVHTSVDLEGTGTIVRRQESNLGNLLADIVRAFHDGTDIAFVNSGSIRCDRVVRATKTEEGTGPPLTVRDLIDILPYDNAIVVKRVTSDALLDALENSFSDAHTDGRFLHFSGLTVSVDWTQPEGSRVIEAWYQSPVCRERVLRDANRTFTVAMAAFIADGFDGYSGFRQQQTIVSEEGAITDTQLLLRTMGYGHADSMAQHEDSVDEDEARFERARNAVVSSWDCCGLPIVSPRLEGRITTRRKELQEGLQHDMVMTDAMQK